MNHIEGIPRANQLKYLFNVINSSIIHMATVNHNILFPSCYPDSMQMQTTFQSTVVFFYVDNTINRIDGGTSCATQAKSNMWKFSLVATVATRYKTEK